MKSLIVVFNAGSSSLKFSVYGLDQKVILQGEVENLFTHPKIWLQSQGAKKYVNDPLSPNLEAVFQVVMQEIHKVADDHEIVAIAHRVVHGGKIYKQPTLITPDVLTSLKQFIPLAPLHQPYNLEVIEACIKAYGHIPQTACFDTSFHRTQSRLAELFPLPLSFEEDGVIRYGFHGLSYEYIASKLPTYAGDKATKRVIVAHLGNGASLCAMKDLKSVSTSMGFTALDGLMMGTRPGNIDPGVLLYLLQEKSYSLDQIQDLLYKQSGLKGVSGLSEDMRDLLQSTSVNAALAIDLFCFTAAKQMGSLIPTVGGLDVLVFTAGIGENCPQVRSRICSYFPWLGLEVDEKLNQSNASKISSKDSKVDVYVIPTDEEAIMAKNAIRKTQS
jgi:acetate kinase